MGFEPLLLSLGPLSRMPGIDVPWCLLFALRRHLGGIGRARNPAGSELFPLDVIFRLLRFDAIGFAISVHGGTSASISKTPPANRNNRRGISS